MPFGKEHLDKGILSGLIDLHIRDDPQGPEQFLGTQIHHLEDLPKIEQRVECPGDGVLQDHRRGSAPEGSKVDEHPSVVAEEGHPVPVQVQGNGIFRLDGLREDKKGIHGRFTSFRNQV